MSTLSLATAMFSDPWAGLVPAHVVAFTTTRKGRRVTRYRWQRVDGQSCGGHTPAVSVDVAVRGVSWDRRFSDVRKVES
ncbi:MAG: hypothetical protein E5X34_13245 [Mesorhizobium sp.]|uniref:hypothetical protein n=1 Tax=Mesorhizobium sp. TaxID=1871066 RepID=UPI00120E2501|nr:hypothetical protein [Mesorhizobium sp.]TIR24015.1 MAG: hypothetical protein E5X34_13245 [Mesorhizobium sp.]